MPGTNQQAQQGGEGDAPHRAEAFGAMRRNEERKGHTHSGPTGGSSKTHRVQIIGH